MKNKFSLILKLIFVFTCTYFQTLAQELIVAPAHLICDYDVSEKLDNQVKSKLQRAMAQYGISSEIGMSRFAMVPSIIINNESTQASIPIKCDVDFDFVISLQDIYSGKVFSSFTTNTIGIGNNKTNAVSVGVSKIRLIGNNFSDFIVDSKKKIIAYYETQVTVLIAKAQVAASARNFEEALYILSEMPEECPSFSSKVVPLIETYYEQERNLIGEKILANARAIWASSPNEEGAKRVAEILADLPPSCSSSDAARSFVNQIGSKTESLQNWELKYLEREQTYKHDEHKSVIEAAKAIGEAFAHNQPVPIYKVNVW